MATNKKIRMTIHEINDMAVLDLGPMDIWDGADLALIRETLTKMIEVEGRSSIGVDMQYVKYIPSGFFGMLYDWHERGIVIRAYSPQPNVRQMRWFLQFFNDQFDGWFLLRTDITKPADLTRKPAWTDGPQWNSADEDTAAVTSEKEK